MYPRANTRTASFTDWLQSASHPLNPMGWRRSRSRRRTGAALSGWIELREQKLPQIEVLTSLPVLLRHLHPHELSAWSCWLTISLWDGRLFPGGSRQNPGNKRCTRIDLIRNACQQGLTTLSYFFWSKTCLLWQSYCNIAQAIWAWSALTPLALGVKRTLAGQTMAVLILMQSASHSATKAG